MLYGYNATTDGDDPLITLAKNTLLEFSDATLAGKWTVDSLPICEFLDLFLSTGDLFISLYSKCKTFPHGYREPDS